MQLEEITSLFQNQLVQGGLVLSLMTTLVMWARGLPENLKTLAFRRWVVRLEITDQDDLFNWVKKWFHRQDFSLKWTILDGFTYWSESDERRKIGMSPGVGSNFFRFQGKWMRVVFSREREQLNRHESFTFQCLSRSRPQLLALLEEAQASANEHRLGIYTPASYGDWRQSQSRSIRSARTVIGGWMDDLISDAQTFLDRRSYYERTGQPHRRGYLLHGPPGNGKTSAVLALASELCMDVYCCGLQGVTDSSLLQLFAALPKRCVLLLEDLDRQVDRLDRGKDDGPTTAGLLNAIDGVSSSDGRILVITANDPGKLPDVMIRSGRIDKRILVGNPNQPEVDALAKLLEVRTVRAEGSMSDCRERLLSQSQ